MLSRGDPAPLFVQRSTGNPRYSLHAAAGRYIVLCFYATAGDAMSRAVLTAVENSLAVFNDAHAAFFGVSIDPADEAVLRDQLPGRRHFLDFDGSASRLYGALPVDAKSGEKNLNVMRKWVVLDPTTRILQVVPMQGPDGGARAVIDYVKSLPPPALYAGIRLQAPVLYLPNIFEPALCEELIKIYEAHGGEESGFMREENGKTVLVSDHSHKRRRDHILTDQKLISTIQSRIQKRIVPEIRKIHQFEVTRMERYLVGCYRAEDQAHFQPHRDNTTKGTAHRRFAVSINLNADFEGGEICFPEYGPQSFKPPPGTAVVFSCSLLHAVTTMTSGRRYAFLPFLYDDAAAKLREENLKFLELPKDGTLSGAKA